LLLFKITAFYNLLYYTLKAARWTVKNAHCTAASQLLLGRPKQCYN